MIPGFCAQGAQKPNWWGKEFLARAFRTVSSRARVMGGDACDAEPVLLRVTLGVTSFWDGRCILPANPTGVPRCLSDLVLARERKNQMIPRGLSRGTRGLRPVQNPEHSRPPTGLSPSSSVAPSASRRCPSAEGGCGLADTGRAGRLAYRRWLRQRAAGRNQQAAGRRQRASLELLAACLLA